MTNIPSSHPVIPVLLRHVEQRFGQTINSKQAISRLVAELRFQLNEDTIRRLWHMRDDEYSTIRHSTLDILSAYIGAHDWENFVQQIEKENGVESTLVHHGEVLTTDKMPINSSLTITWLPDRSATLRYIGEAQWIVEKVENSTTLAVGDTFSCRTFAQGEPLYIDRLVHLGQPYSACRIGTINGLSSITLESKKCISDKQA